MIGSDSNLKKLVVKLLINSGLEVEVGGENRAQLESFNQSSFYKIILIEQVKNDFNSSQFNNLLDWFRQREEAKILIFTLTSLVKNPHPHLEKWNQLTKIEQEYLLEINLWSDVLLLVGQDVLADYSHQPIMQSVVAGLNRGYLLDPGIPVYFQTTQAFISVISQYILSPWRPNQILVKGNLINSSQLITTLVSKLDRIWQQKLDVKRVGGEVAGGGWQPREIINNQQSGAEEWLAGFIKQLMPPVHMENREGADTGLELIKPKKVVFSETKNKPTLSPKTNQSPSFPPSQPNHKRMENREELPKTSEEKIDQALFSLFA